jgi:hypothetical protein
MEIEIKCGKCGYPLLKRRCRKGGHPLLAQSNTKVWTPTDGNRNKVWKIKCGHPLFESVDTHYVKEGYCSNRMEMWREMWTPTI